MLKWLIEVFIFKKEPIWKDYFGDWHEPINMTENNNKIPYEMPIIDCIDYDYNDSFTIMDSKNRYGIPTIEQLGSLLCKHCQELDSLRNRKSIGYYANTSEYQVGYNQINMEDLQNLDSVLLKTVTNKTKGVDFIFSSPGGVIEVASLLGKKIRNHTDELSFLLCGSTYSAAVLMAFGGDEIIMQSLAHLAPINPKINGFDTYVARKIYRTYQLQKIFVPWAAKSLPEAKVAENNVNFKTLVQAEKFTYQVATKNLSQYLFKTHKLSIIPKIKTFFKIRKIVNFFFKYENHYSHNMPICNEEILAVGLPIKDADEPLNTILRKIRNICDEITSTKFILEDGSSYYIRKVYFSSTHWLVLHDNK